MGAEGWGEEKFIPRGQSTVENKERDGGRGVEDYAVFSPLPRPLPPLSTLTANQKWLVEQTIIASFLALALQATVRGRVNNQILGGLTCWTLD